MQVRQALVVVRLRLRFASRYGVVRDADSRAKRQRPLDHVARERRHGMRGVEVLGAEDRSEEDRKDDDTRSTTEETEARSRKSFDNNCLRVHRVLRGGEPWAIQR